MAYVPPHKRHSEDNKGHYPSPDLLPPQFRKRQSDKSARIMYAQQSITKWFALGLELDDNNNNHQTPSSVHLRQISLEFIERKIGQKPLVLVNSHLPQQQVQDIQGPWETITQNVLQDLLSSFENLRKEIEVQNLQEQVKPTLVARFGKILFYGGPSFTQGVRGNLASGTILGQLKRLFYTSIPASYMEKFTSGKLPNIGVEFEEEKDLYLVKLSDSSRPNAIISCKCSVMKDQKKLQLYKIELNQVRHMVTDISCLTKNLDLRLMLYSKRILISPEDDELQCIMDLIESAVLDPNVMGGLRWPLGKASSGNRFSVVGVWHTITKAFRSPSLRLKVRHADRFDFQTSSGESASEVYLKLRGIVSKLEVPNGDISLISKKLEECLNLIWVHFLDCEPFLG